MAFLDHSIRNYVSRVSLTRPAHIWTKLPRYHYSGVCDSSSRDSLLLRFLLTMLFDPGNASLALLSNSNSISSAIGTHLLLKQRGFRLVVTGGHLGIFDDTDQLA